MYKVYRAISRAPDELLGYVIEIRKRSSPEKRLIASFTLEDVEWKR